MIGPRTQRRDRLHPRPEAARGHTRRPFRLGHLPTGSADQLVQLILRHDRLHGGDVCDLVPLGVEILSHQWMLTAPAALRLERAYHIDPFERHQCTRVPLVAGLPTGSTATGFALGPFRGRLGRIARRGPRRGARVVLQPLRQLPDRRFQALDGGLQRCHAGLEGADVVLDRTWGLIPQLLGEGTLGRHGLRCYATWPLAGKYFSC